MQQQDINFKEYNEFKQETKKMTHAGFLGSKLNIWNEVIRWSSGVQSDGVMYVNMAILVSDKEILANKENIDFLVLNNELGEMFYIASPHITRKELLVVAGDLVVEYTVVIHQYHKKEFDFLHQASFKTDAVHDINWCYKTDKFFGTKQSRQILNISRFRDNLAAPTQQLSLEVGFSPRVVI